MKKSIICGIFAGTLFFSSCGGTEVVYVTETLAPETSETKTSTTLKPLQTTPPLATRPPSDTPTYNGGYNPEFYDDFLWESVNDFWWLFTKDQLLQMGLLVCEEFDRGSSLDDVTYSLLDIMSDTNTMFLMEGLSAVVAGAVVFLCPEHEWWLDTI